MDGTTGTEKVWKSATLDEDLVAAIDAARGDVPFATFINRKLRESMGLATH